VATGPSQPIGSLPLRVDPLAGCRGLRPSDSAVQESAVARAECAQTLVESERPMERAGGTRSKRGRGERVRVDLLATRGAS
jgi:hypothetical protein